MLEDECDFHLSWHGDANRYQLHVATPVGADKRASLRNARYFKARFPKSVLFKDYTRSTAASPWTKLGTLHTHHF